METPSANALTQRPPGPRLDAVTLETTVRLIGGIPLALLAAVVVGSLLRKWGRTRTVGERSRGIIGLELARSVAEVQERVGDVGDPRRAEARRAVDLDGFFVPAYWAVLVALSALLTQRHEDVSSDSWSLWLGLAAGLAATVAAVADMIENARLRGILGLPLASTKAGDVASVRAASLVKWAAFAAALGLLSGLFSGEERTWFTFGLFLTSLGVAWVGVVGLVWHAALRVVFFGALLFAVIAFVYFAVSPDGFLDGFRL